MTHLMTTGDLHISSDCCPLAFVSDLNYWGIPLQSLSQCCMKKYVDMKEQLEWEESPQDEMVEEIFKPDTSSTQKFLWNLFEHPNTSLAARVVGVISVTCIFISTIILTLDTLPYFEDHEDKIMGQFAPFVIIEAVYMAWFTLEFIIRVICCPSKMSFFMKSMNWIDLLGKFLIRHPCIMQKLTNNYKTFSHCPVFCDSDIELPWYN